MKGEKHRRGAIRAVVALSVQCGLLLFLWVLLSGGSPHDLWAGLVGAALGALGFSLVRAAVGMPYRFRWRWIVEGKSVPGEIMSNTWIVLSVLAARLLRRGPDHSALQDVGFDDQGESDDLVGRQILAVVYSTTSPNFIALGFEGEPGRGVGGLRLVYHQLRATPISKELRGLGATP